jgi:hypothetical protein
MSHAKSVLQPGETIVAAIGRLHCIVYRWVILSLVAGVALVWLGSARHSSRLSPMPGSSAGSRCSRSPSVRDLVAHRHFPQHGRNDHGQGRNRRHRPIRGGLRIAGTTRTNNIEQGFLAAPFELRDAMIAK